MMNIHNNKMLRDTTARPQGQAPHGVFISPTLGYFNYGPGKISFAGVFSGKYLPMVNIHNNKLLRCTTARPQGQAPHGVFISPTKSGYFNYGPGKLSLAVVFSGKYYC
jgi:hypothetical protein